MSHRSHWAATLVALICTSTTAWADHAGPGGGASASGPISTISAGTLEKGHWAIALRAVFTKPRHLRGDELLLRSAEGIEAHGTDYVLNSYLGGAVGISDDLSLSAELPFVRRHNIREGDSEQGEVVDRGTSEGVGDLALLLKYRALHRADWSLAILGGIKLPTGRTHLRDREAERFETEHQPGTGSWDPIVGFAISRAFGTNALDASLLYQFGTRGAQRTKLGDKAQAGIAFSRRFGPSEHQHDEDADDHDGGDHDADHHHHDARHGGFDGVLEILADWEGRETVAGVLDRYSGGRSIWLAPGARFTSATRWSFAGSVGVPLAQHIRRSHPDNAYRLTFSLGRSF